MYMYACLLSAEAVEDIMSQNAIIDSFKVLYAFWESNPCPVRETHALKFLNPP